MSMDWDNDRNNRGDRNNEYRGRNRDRGSERDLSDRAGDEVRSWFGDDDAERRRREDERRSYEADRNRGNYNRDYRGATRSDYDRGSSSFGGGSYGGSRDRFGPANAQTGFGGDYGSRSSYGSGYDRDRSGYGSENYGGSWGSSDYRSNQDRGNYYGSDYNRGREGNRNDRGFFEKAGDEVASWFGDEDAERRRRQDAQHRGRGPKGYTRSDDRVREDVNDKLSDDWHVDATNIEVTVKDGEVTLNGTVTERNAKRRAEDVVEAVSGVKHVQNNLRVQATGGPSTFGSTSSTTGSTSTTAGSATTTSSLGSGSSANKI